MPVVRRLTRRVFLRRAGRAGLGIIVLSTGIVACATDGADEVAPASASDGPSPGSEPATGAQGAASASASPGATDQPAEAAFDWRRVDLDVVSAYLMAKDDRAVVVDTGVEGSAPAIEEALVAVGLGWSAVDHVIFTHNHPDHVGSATAVLEATDAQAYAGEADILTIASPRPITPIGDGDAILGLQIIETPGHTPGHISVLDPAGGILVAGDAMVGRADGGGVAGPPAAYTADMDEAHESIRKLADFQFTTALFGHGEPVEQDADRLVSEFAAGLSDRV